MKKLKNKKLLFADFCSGIGGGRLGLEQAGMKCLTYSEINVDSNNTYNLFFGQEKNLGDLTKIDSKSLKGVDVLIAGFPCQAFSIVGKRKGFNDERGQIIFYLIKILKDSNIPFDKRRLKSYGKIRSIPNDVYEILQYYTREKYPYKQQTKDSYAK